MNKTITLKQAISLLENCDAIIYRDKNDSSCVTYHTICDVEDDEDVFMTISLEYDGEHFAFSPRSNQTIGIENNRMKLIDTHGDIVYVSLLQTVAL